MLRRVRPLLAVSLFSLLSLSLLSGGSASANTRHTDQIWINLTALGPIAGQVVYFVEAQPRLTDITRLDPLLMRGAVGWKFSPHVTLMQGYAHVWTQVDDAGDLHENRLFQQLGITGHPWGGELTSRTRLEERFRNDGDDVGVRFREFVRFEKPFVENSDNVNALVYTELFVGFNQTDWGAPSGFDQLRSFVGVEVGLPGASTLELGYLNQTINLAGDDWRVNHVAALSFWYRPSAGGSR